MCIWCAEYFSRRVDVAENNEVPVSGNSPSDGTDRQLTDKQAIYIRYV